jgi:type VI secretion system protein ImpF
MADDTQLVPSIIDRLTSYQRGATRVYDEPEPYDIERMRQAVRDDLADLLNTRRTIESHEDFTLSNRSVLAYGLPDSSTCSTANPRDRESLRRSIKDAIDRFEPRLLDATVTVEPGEDRRLRCRIAALLRVDPVPVPVSFDTIMHPESGKFEVPGEEQ